MELKKGTDGLLHVSNVGPGRVGHIEDVIARGDVLDVIVQEVDKDRGRIGLKLVAKHENGSLVQPEELIERAKSAPRGRPRRSARAAVTADAAAAAAARAARNPGVWHLRGECQTLPFHPLRRLIPHGTALQSD